jgi:hypothetical protein
MIISSIIEFFSSRSYYLNPIEVYEIEVFYNSFIEDFKNGKNLDKYFYKYNLKLKNYFKKNFLYDKYFLSSVKKVSNNSYEISLVSEKKYLLYIFFRFLIKVPIYKMIIRKVNKNEKFESHYNINFKIVYLK